MSEFERWFNELGITRDEFLDDACVLYDDLKNGKSEQEAVYRVERIGGGMFRIVPEDNDVPSLALDGDGVKDAVSFLDEMYDGSVHGYESMQHNMSRND